MKSSFIYPCLSKSTFVIALICVVGLLGTKLFSSHKTQNISEECALANSINNPKAAAHIVKLSISSNDFSDTKQLGKNESLNQSFCSPLYGDKLIRFSLFDAEQAFALTQKQAWYIRTTYISGLSPLWRPSIPIAHKKLII